MNRWWGSESAQRDAATVEKVNGCTRGVTQSEWGQLPGGDGDVHGRPGGRTAGQRTKSLRSDGISHLWDLKLAISVHILRAKFLLSAFPSAPLASGGAPCPPPPPPPPQPPTLSLSCELFNLWFRSSPRASLCLNSHHTYDSHPLLWLVSPLASADTRPYHSWRRWQLKRS